MSDLNIALITVAAIAAISVGVWLARKLIAGGRNEILVEAAEESARENKRAEEADRQADLRAADLRESLRVRGARDLFAEDATDE